MSRETIWWQPWAHDVCFPPRRSVSPLPRAIRLPRRNIPEDKVDDKVGGKSAGKGTESEKRSISHSGPSVRIAPKSPSLRERYLQRTTELRDGEIVEKLTDGIIQGQFHARKMEKKYRDELLQRNASLLPRRVATPHPKIHRFPHVIDANESIHPPPRPKTEMSMYRPRSPSKEDKMDGKVDEEVIEEREREEPYVTMRTMCTHSPRHRGKILTPRTQWIQMHLDSDGMLGTMTRQGHSFLSNTMTSTHSSLLQSSMDIFMESKGTMRLDETGGSHQTTRRGPFSKVIPMSMAYRKDGRTGHEIVPKARGRRDLTHILHSYGRIEPRPSNMSSDWKETASKTLFS
eukprot:TRINITY_DN108_c2_g1_i1.p1 TRINITY_DN108_c2_g1~~TRINITY_DN108_c2_g1_i1.p1  ORF type:complete len:345 (+),score=87.12 TRINITY_DN108_c2_g1_i1:152-1186(+)